MKLVRIKYIPPLGPMLQDLQRVFPNYGTITAALLNELGGMLEYPEKKRFAYVKEYRNASNVRTHVIVSTLVKDSFIVPNWIQGTVLLVTDLVDVVDHVFMGHETPIADPPNETPEENIP